MALDHVQIVLSHPSEPRNVGATCRAMKNAGISRLAIVTDTQINLEAARPIAVDARDILDHALIQNDLEKAVSGSALVAGVTRRTGQRRKLVSFVPRQLGAKVTSGFTGTVSIVFGNEQSGLSDAELQLCHMAVGIPASPALPSLNLSHAVQIITYELYLADLSRDTGTDRVGHRPIEAADLSHHIAHIVQSLEDLGFHTQAGPQGMPAFLGDILGRAMLSEPEAARFRGMFEKLRGMHGDRNGS